MYKNFSYISKTHTRLDVLISSCLKISKNKAGNYCDNGFVSVDRKIRKSGYSINEKSEIIIKQKIEDLIPGNSPNSSKLEIKIAYEDSDLIILDKPRNIHCVRKEKNEEPTIADFLADNYPSSIYATENTKESGLINRLDYQTSGLILAAKHKEAADELRKIQKQKKIEKTYQAIVKNFPKTKVICSGFIHNKNNSVAISEEQKDYTTRIISAERFSKNLYLLEIKGTNFYRHQIRAHLASIGSGLIGDSLYNKDSKYKQLFLHSCKIKLNIYEKEIAINSEIKKEWERQLASPTLLSKS